MTVASWGAEPSPLREGRWWPPVFFVGRDCAMPELMKAVLLKAPSLLVLEDVPRPRAGPGEVLVRVTHVGICGTDMKILRGAIPVAYPRIMGHEIVGRVAAVGAGASFAVGQRVVVDPVTFCGTCSHCRTGREHLCPKGELLGRDRDGGCAEWVVTPAQNTYALPDGIDDKEGPLIQVLTTCLHAHRRFSILPGQSVVVLGLGVTGQLHVQLAKARGAHPVIGITRSQWKQQLAVSLGADLALSASEGNEEVKREVSKATDGRGVDVVIETAGTASALAQAIDLAGIGGTVMVFSIHTEREASLPLYDLYFKELTLANSRAARGEDFGSCIDLVGRGVVRLAPLITGVFPLTDLAGAIAAAENEGSGTMKIVLENAK